MRDLLEQNQMSIACWLEYSCEGQVISYFNLAKYLQYYFFTFSGTIFIKVCTCLVKNKLKPSTTKK